MNSKSSFTTITVSELIDLLQEQLPTDKVAFSTPSLGAPYTQQVHSLKGEFEEVSIYKTAYSRSGFAVVEDESVPERDSSKILILS
jgi:hypothetical protein